MIKAIFFDIDGTLVSFQTHRMSDRTKAALRQAQQNGIKLFIATGRHTQVMTEANVLENFPFDGYVTLNGQFCYTPPNHVIYEKSICREDMRALVSMLEEEPFAVLFVERDFLYLNMVNDRVRELHDRVGLQYPPVLDIRRALDHDIYQLNFYLDREQEDRRMARLPNCAATRWSPSFADIIPLGGSKEIGVTKMAEHFGFDRSEIMAFGDGENDLEMIQYAEIGIAMGNANNIVKSAANYVTDDVDNDGIFNALKHFSII